MAATCKKCGLNFEQLKLTVYVKVFSDKGAINMNGIPLFCPACGTRNLLDLRPYGFFFWEQQFYHWRTATTKGTFNKDRRQYDVQIGSLTLNFPGELIADDKFTVDQMCYAAVPVFSQLEGAPSIPMLPVKRKYLDLVDIDEGVTPELTVKGEYRFRFKLKVLEGMVEVTRPAVAVRPDAFAKDNDEVFSGVHLVMWPKINFKEWRRYFLRFGCEDKYFGDLVNSTRDLKVWAHAASSLEQDAAEKKWIVLDTVSDDGKTRYGCIESRPDWVAIEIEDKGRNEVGGGMWHIELAPESYSTGQPVTVGIDFGTSNTCVAWPSPNGLDLLPLTDCSHVLIRGSKLPEVLSFADTWPPRKGFGKHNAMLPTEILTREKLNDLRSHARSIESWRPVVDYSIPSAGVEINYKEQEHVIADFKWQNMVADPELQPFYKEIQKRYLEFMLLVAMAELAANKSLRSALHLNFSYPLAFDQEMRTDFQGVLDECVEAVSRQTGVVVGSDLPLDEARAAARDAGVPSGDDAACLYVDIGGGSTDIALLKLGAAGRDKDRYVYVCSFQYAGGGLVNALSKGGCLIPGSDIANFRRKVREVGSVKELMNTESVFLNRKKNAIEAKGSYFYAYLRQFLARLLAAHIINGEWKGAAALGAAASSENGRPVYRVLLYTLGNGWGFGSFIDNYYSARFSESLTAEVNQIIDEAIKREVAPADSPVVAVDSFTPKNPKGAVAFGAVSEVAGRGVEEARWNARTILGWTTQVGHGRKVPWFREVVEGNSKPPVSEEAIPPNAALGCPPDEWPAFPANLPRPEELDEGLRQTRQYLSQCSPSSIGKEWFVASPFHVLMEKLFKPKLEELS